MSVDNVLVHVDETTTFLHNLVANIDATPSPPSPPSETATMNFGTLMPGNIDADRPATSPSITIDSNAPVTLAKPTVPCFQHIPPSHTFAIASENQNLDAFMPGYLATPNPKSSIGMREFEFYFLAQLDPHSKGKVLSVLTKAFLDLKTVDGSEEMFRKLLKLVSHDRERKYVVVLVLVAAGSALLGALSMFLALAFL
ncbi:hypothetical protein C8R41DRAFT_871365 [Lentinula lateritia]|uniref:Uncharacterized protein n=1 Tax=Lentinula lateritia TaxID=40482 RepID=A0ABQ8V4K3_9AGAR|nr:hypothetical protein C8R41DRAFT_871365 [Lentinula lateritia]